MCIHRVRGDVVTVRFSTRGLMPPLNPRRISRDGEGRAAVHLPRKRMEINYVCPARIHRKATAAAPARTSSTRARAYDDDERIGERASRTKGF